MTNALTGPIGRLRAAGCKVSTVIGHDPNIGSFQYRVTLPAGVPTGADRIDALGHAYITPRPKQRSVLVWASVYRLDAPLPDKQLINAARVDTARALEAVADHVENYDRASVSSRQNFAETGQYLPQIVTVNIATVALFSVEAVVDALGGCIIEKRPTEGACGYLTIRIEKPNTERD